MHTSYEKRKKPIHFQGHFLRSSAHEQQPIIQQTQGWGVGKHFVNNKYMVNI